MLLVLRDYTKISIERTMDEHGPQTRKEKKGGRGGKGVIYSAKHVRLTAALVAGAGPRVGVEVEPKAPQKKR